MKELDLVIAFICFLLMLISGILLFAWSETARDIDRCVNGGVLQWNDDIYVCLLARPEVEVD